MAQAVGHERRRDQSTAQADQRFEHVGGQAAAFLAFEHHDDIRAVIFQSGGLTGDIEGIEQAPRQRCAFKAPRKTFKLERPPRAGGLP